MTDTLLRFRGAMCTSPPQSHAVPPMAPREPAADDSERNGNTFVTEEEDVNGIDPESLRRVLRDATNASSPEDEFGVIGGGTQPHAVGRSVIVDGPIFGSSLRGSSVPAAHSTPVVGPAQPVFGVSPGGGGGTAPVIVVRNTNGIFVLQPVSNTNTVGHYPSHSAHGHHHHHQLLHHHHYAGRGGAGLHRSPIAGGAAAAPPPAYSAAVRELNGAEACADPSSAPAAIPSGAPSFVLTQRPASLHHTPKQGSSSSPLQNVSPPPYSTTNGSPSQSRIESEK